MNFGHNFESNDGDAAASREKPSYYYHEQEQEQHQEQWMDAAYRRLGQRLSQQLQTIPISAEEYQQLPQNFGHYHSSAFSDFNPQSSNISVDEYCQRRYFGADNNSILKNMTINSKAVFRLIQKSASYNRRNYPPRNPSILSTSMRADEETSCGSISSNTGSNKKGLLQSVLELQPTNENRKCLSQPSEPVSNGGMDNSEGNLICYERDLIHPSRLHVLNPESRKEVSRRIGKLRVIELLGQGTFAQVFGVECVETGERFALKIVKNKQAYTRQATVEIDVLRALVNSRNKVIELEAYFVYANHLCLLFEWLGSNLYEILKQRQFRGLPLATVRCLLKQALEGLQELGKRSIIHCDLKPENILVVSSDENVREVMSKKTVGTADNPVKAQNQQQNRSNEEGNTEFQRTVDPPQIQNFKGIEESRNATGSLGSLPSSTAENSQHKSSESGSSNTSLTYNTTTTTASINIDNRQEDDSVEENNALRMKLIDFGSACFESSIVHCPQEQNSYIQSRFYRSPEVLVGLGYDSAIDMWSLGCVAAELFLGLPILPGTQEHDQIGRIVEMMGPIPDWMIEQGTKARNFFVKEHSEEKLLQNLPQSPPNDNALKSDDKNIKWRLKTAIEYLQSLSESQLNRKGGKASLVALAQQQKQHRYFRYTKLSDIILFHGRQRISTNDEKEEELLQWFVHLLSGMLDPDPWKRWTANQASCHPFFMKAKAKSTAVVAGKSESNDDNIDNKEIESHVAGEEKSWMPPWDPSICRRKLLFVQKTREKQKQRQYSKSHPEEKSNYPLAGTTGSDSCGTKTTMNVSVSSMPSGHQSANDTYHTPPPLSSLSVHFRDLSIESSLGSSSFRTSRTQHSQQRAIPSSLLLISNANNPPSALSSGSAFLSKSYNANTTMVPTMIDESAQPSTEFGYAISRPTGGVLPPHHYQQHSNYQQHSHQQQIPEELQLSGHSFPNSGLSSLHTTTLSPTNHMVLGNSAVLPLSDSNITRRPVNIPEHRHGSYHTLSKSSIPKQPFASKSHQSLHQSQQEFPASYANASFSSSLLAQQLQKQATIQQQQQQQQQQQPWHLSQSHHPQQLSFSAGAGAGADYYDTPSGSRYMNEQKVHQHYHTTTPNLYPSALAYQEQGVYPNYYSGHP
eukprot:CAMPEP_0178935636 /NCGR_PEP_ID=MMETSP0786-20121207/24666_1 /TAXON_ID=186022 /ORGANISM="Thalassionema frauenfeldii, Strain CCMP 1798" /LENGTH=1139 /DNA_ID=CAMNT_0020613827 /DNA_START=287 /DNA_END=3703 /DNA_ORIENTATION=-